MKPDDSKPSSGGLLQSLTAQVNNVRSTLESNAENVKSAIESKFNKPKPDMSPRSPMYDPRHERSSSRQLRRQGYYPQDRYAPRTADPRIAQFDLPPPEHGRQSPRDYGRYEPRSARIQYYDSRSPRSPSPRSPLPQPSPRPQSPAIHSPIPRSPLPHSPAIHSPVPRSPRPQSPAGLSPMPRSPALHSPAVHSPIPSPIPRSPDPRAPTPTSGWTREKTPSSPHPPRLPPRPPHTDHFNYSLQVPHTAHPAGYMYQPDPRREIYRQRSPVATPEFAPRSAQGFPQSNEAPKVGLLESFSKGRFGGHREEHLPLPSPDLKAPAYDTRQYGYYEYRSPAVADYDLKSAPLEDVKTPLVERVFDEDEETLAMSDNATVKHPEDEVPQKKGFVGTIENWLAQFKLWLRIKFGRRRSRIPSVQPELDERDVERLEQQLREDYVFAWTTVAGAFLIQFSTFGYVWSWGAFQDYYLNHYPGVHSAGRLSWIGSLQLMLVFAFGLISGKMFDAGWFHFTVMLGSLIFGMGVFTLSFVDPHNFFHLFLVQGLFLGTGVGLVFLPTALVCLLHFKEKKALITGIVLSGSSFGAMVYPILLSRLLPSRGFGGAVRGTSYMVVATLVIANCLVALPRKQWTPRFPPIDIMTYLKERHYALASGGIFLVFLSIWFPLNYIEEFAVQHGAPRVFSFYSLIIVSLSGLIGRIVMGLAADRYGAWNLLIPTTVIVGATTISMASMKNVGAVVVVSMFYGFFSGAWLSLLISALSSLATRQGEIGHRTGVALTLASFGAFLSGPAHAGLLSNKWVWARPIAFFTILLFGATAILVYVRMLVAHKRRFQFV